MLQINKLYEAHTANCLSAGHKTWEGTWQVSEPGPIYGTAALQGPHSLVMTSPDTCTQNSHFETCLQLLY